MGNISYKIISKTVSYYRRPRKNKAWKKKKKEKKRVKL